MSTKFVAVKILGPGRRRAPAAAGRHLGYAAALQVLLAFALGSSLDAAFGTYDRAREEKKALPRQLAEQMAHTWLVAVVYYAVRNVRIQSPLQGVAGLDHYKLGEVQRPPGVGGHRARPADALLHGVHVQPRAMPTLTPPEALRRAHRPPMPWSERAWCCLCVDAIMGMVARVWLHISDRLKHGVAVVVHQA